MNRNIALLMTILVSFPLLGYAEDRNTQNQNDSIRARMGDTRDEVRFHKMVDDAAEVYSAIVRGPNGNVPSSVIKNTRCIAVLPKVMTGAIVIGGTHGDGLASCKRTNHTWSQPAAISLTQGSIGLQAGAKSTDLVLFIQNQKAEDALKRGEFELGADLSAVAGTYDSKADTSTAGILAYTRTEGLFAGVSVNGSKIGKDQDAMARYYGTKVDYTAILEGRDNPDSTGYAQKFTKLLP